MSDCYFSMNQLSVGYNGKPLISNINVELERGQILTLIGPNGSGKSTILKSISQHLPIISGNVMLDGEDMEEMSYKDKYDYQVVNNEVEQAVEEIENIINNL